ncbi:MAG: insulinase family protein [Bacteroidales bacterium]|nr:insulinase family protein [Bacteroidales bacterium]
MSCSNDKKQDLKIEYEKYTLPNGLDVILHTDKSDPIVAFAVQYHVGSNREKLGHTGFAHLFEHMMFQQSENVPEDQFFKIIQNAGGELNGGTGNDGTTYYEVVPKNALETILWLESDRMGYLTNTVTKKAFANQQNVVQNEKRERTDNQPYGHTSWVIGKALYPEGHPYNWQVIGEMQDLFNATVEDVKEFHNKFYIPNNATIVLAGDFDVVVAKKLIDKYFGEIPRGNDIEKPKPMPVTLVETKKLFHEDNFAKAPQLTMVWPTVPQYSKDSYALQYLAQLLSEGKKSPMYKVIVKDKQFASSTPTYNNSQELAGEFQVTITAFPNIKLGDVEKAVFESFEKFEKDGVTDNDIERVKASLETDFYNGIASVLDKSFQLASYNAYTGDPSFYKKDLENLKSVSKDDIIRVYNTYIKGKPFVETSFVPKGQPMLAVEGSVKAKVVEEDITHATEVKIADTTEEKIVKTKTSFDRSVRPALGEDPKLSIPTIWDSKLANGMKVYGIEQNELPLVQFNIVINGGHYLDKIEKPGVAYLLTKVINQGTKNKTPEQFEDEIKMLGASIWISMDYTNISINVNTLSRNFEKTMAIVQEMLLEPRWDSVEFNLAKINVINRIKRNKANPSYLAANEFNKLIYGSSNILSIPISGTESSVSSITLDDLKEYYNSYFTPSISNFHIVGSIKQEQVMNALADLGNKWLSKDVKFPEYQYSAQPEKSKIYLVDVPGAFQSVINIGNLSVSATHPDYYPLQVMNYKLGGSFNGKVNMVLREEKGFTYGARTNFDGNEFNGSFTANANVRSSATAESVAIFKDIMTKYRDGITDEELQFTKNALLKSNALRFETLWSLIGMLQDISSYNKAKDYVKQEEEVITSMTSDKLKALAQKYLNPDKMYYVVAGDAKTQAPALKKLKIGEVEVVKE